MFLHDDRQESVEIILYHLVTFRYPGFQTWSIKNDYMTTIITDKPVPLQIACCFGYTFLPYPQHVCCQFLGHYEIITLQSVMAQEQPAAQLLVYAVVPVAYR